MSKANAQSESGQPGIMNLPFIQKAKDDTLTQEAIALPDVTRFRVLRLIGERDKLKAAYEGRNTTINEILDLSRDLLGVPKDWVLADIDTGFQAPPVSRETTKPLDANPAE